MVQEPKNKKWYQDRCRATLLIAAILLALAAALLYRYRVVNSRQAADPYPFENSEIVLCYPLRSEKLTKRILHVRKEIGEMEKVGVILRELKKERCLAENTTLLDYAADMDGTIYLNVSREILDDRAGFWGDVARTYAIVNSLLSTMKDAKKVQILVGGQPVYTLGGIVYTYKPLEFNKNIMED